MRDERRRALEEERDFLLASLDDLERESAAGDVDNHDRATLEADYTRRAAAVLRALEGGTVGSTADRVPDPKRRRVVVAGVALVAIVAGVLVMQASGRRGSGGLTGLDVGAASAEAERCLSLEQAGDPDQALACYGEVLDESPANVVALTYRGWLQVRSFDLEDGLADLDAAVQLDPGDPASRMFRASGRSRAGDLLGALEDLVAFDQAGPSAEEAALAEQFAPAIVDRVLDGCIAAEVDGSLDVVQVLECYRNVLTVDEGNPTASIYLGWLLARSGIDDERAMQLLDDGLRADPDLTAGYVFRAALRAHLGDIEGALADLGALEGRDIPEDQLAAAAQVRASIDAGQDPLPS